MKRYYPLYTLIIIAILAACALSYSRGFSWFHYFMGFFFCQFAMLKLFSLSGFVEGFQKYDLVAQHFRAYAFIYPFIELFLGLAYLAFIIPNVIYAITISVMGMSAVGVIKALKAGLDVRCACTGTVLDVPLSTVTLTEDVVMGVMALIMLIS
ncbi:MAG TPA: MauE/DoxX family redox-associated membrane protein [Chlamydiales bacterium]|nr:MauE/DoxX family redox-associated membrane protein [Chlamydiales bacterium]